MRESRWALAAPHPPSPGWRPPPTKPPPRPSSSSPYWETPPRATPGGASEGVARPRQEPGAPTSSPVASGALGRAPTGITQAGRGGSASSALQSATGFVLFLFVFVPFLFFALGDPEPGPGSCHHHERHSPSPRPGDGTGRAAAARRPGAVRRRSLLLWPGPSALCLCPAVRLSCSPSPGGPRSARSRAVRSLRSGRSS